jgi:anti-sigma regulatory factor (Ser/Thr protein kinase)
LVGVRERGESIRNFILKMLSKHPSDIAQLAAEKFGISRQAVNRHLNRLVEQNTISKRGKTRNRTYHLRPVEEWTKQFQLDEHLQEDVIWRNEIQPSFENYPDNVVDIWYYGFTEMFNNAIDHSEATSIRVNLRKTATTTQLLLSDNGVGIFKKIQKELELLDERHAILELAKGKLTTDPANHSGEGIFFTSRMFDAFDILSGETFFTHKFGESEDWILEARYHSGTAVWMKLNNHTARKMKSVFEKFTTDEDFGFNKTVVPVRLAQYGQDKLISRSQAKRLLARIDRFKTVIFDFDQVESIGQAFADEIFRVFQNAHADIEIHWIKTSKEVEQMITRARAAKNRT